MHEASLPDTYHSGVPAPTCPWCGVTLAEKARFCVSCGTNLKTPPHQPLGTSAGELNGLAVASFVFSIAACGPGSIVAVILGNIARRQIDDRGGTGEELARWGIAIGWVGIGLIIFGALALLAFEFSSGS